MTRHGAGPVLAVLAIGLLAACGADAEPAEPADLIVLNADPLADIRNTLQIDRVMLRGEWVDRDALLSSE